jgi:hypothetical protein
MAHRQVSGPHVMDLQADDYHMQDQRARLFLQLWSAITDNGPLPLITQLSPEPAPGSECDSYALSPTAARARPNRSRLIIMFAALAIRRWPSGAITGADRLHS